MKVLLLSNMYPSEEEPGYGSFVLRQKERLEAEHGVEFELVVSTMRGGRGANLRKYAELLWRTIAATCRGGYDVVHAHYLLPVAGLSLIPSGVRRKPLVVTAHGTDIFSARRPVFRQLATRALARACEVFVVSDFLGAELLAGFGEPRRGFTVANMGVDTDLFVPGDRAARKAERDLPANRVHLLFIGNFVEQKGIDDLARALVVLYGREVPFVATLLGHGPLLPEVTALVEPLGDSVRLESVVPHERLLPLFQSADLFVLPSRREGVGLLVCLESLACGVPVAAARAGGLPEIVHDGENGIVVEPDDPSGLADALESLIRDPERLDKLAARARESALPYDERAQAAKVADAYRSCLEGRRS